ncbi:cation:proton antiporter [Streptomyces sp. NPDC051041]|uniref:cation:proton antiporter n=1 Tax=Streptomyces sp. NPDC051041 TaxID=3365640 RepID=UPI0037AB76A9
MFASSWLTSWIGIHQIFGAFLFGFVMPREPRRVLAAHLRRPLDDVSVVLLPVFFIVTGLGVDLGALTATDYLALALVVAVACAGKLLGAIVPARLSGLSWREAKERMFTMLVIMALVTTAMAAPLLSRREHFTAGETRKVRTTVADATAPHT